MGDQIHGWHDQFLSVGVVWVWVCGCGCGCGRMERKGPNYLTHKVNGVKRARTTSHTKSMEWKGPELLHTKYGAVMYSRVIEKKKRKLNFSFFVSPHSVAKK